MNLSDLLSEIIDVQQLDCNISGIAINSQHVKPGYLFLAYPGSQSDGRDFIKQSIKNGASAILYEAGAALDIKNTGIPIIPVNRLSSYVGQIACKFYNYPAQNLDVIGVTGTNGKTTVAYQLMQAYLLLGKNAAYIGTIGVGNGTHLKSLGLTTPDSITLQRILRELSEDKTQTVCMEVSSHALSQGRVQYVPFKQAIYTNLSEEHLDYHKTMEEYAAAKARLFSNPLLPVAIINQDDDYSSVMRAAMAKETTCYTYGLSSTANVYATDCKFDISGSSYKVNTPFGSANIVSQSIGMFNIYNSLAIISSLLLDGYSIAEIASVMPKLCSSSGRMEVVATKPTVIVDFAHTPAALENVLTCVRKLQKKGRLWLVFGCGGNRDTVKRPLMGAIACENADEVVLTSDNPRFEEPMAIIDAIASGITSKNKSIKIVDRSEAINYALAHAKPDDVVVIAGKGHEQYQIIENQRIPFSDQKLVQKIAGNNH